MYSQSLMYQSFYFVTSTFLGVRLTLFFEKSQCYQYQKILPLQVMNKIWNKNHEKKSKRSSLSFTVFASLPSSPLQGSPACQAPPATRAIHYDRPITHRGAACKGKDGVGIGEPCFWWVGNNNTSRMNQYFFLLRDWRLFQTIASMPYSMDSKLSF